MALVKVNDDFHVGKFLALTLHPPRSPLLPMRGSENWETEHRISQEPHFTHLLHGTSTLWGDFSFFSFPLVQEPWAKRPGRGALWTVRVALDSRGGIG